MKSRAAAIIIQNAKIALIERNRSSLHYFVFPGGKIEAGETPASAARREIKEELGIKVKIGQLVAEVWYQGTPQYYFLADMMGGKFGHGTGAEMSSLITSPKGSYLPIWLPIGDLLEQQVLPKLMAEYVWNSYLSAWPEQPLRITDRPSDEPV